jgi:hypothetical protein
LWACVYLDSIKEVLWEYVTKEIQGGGGQRVTVKTGQARTYIQVIEVGVPRNGVRDTEEPPL